MVEIKSYLSNSIELCEEINESIKDTKKRQRHN